MFESLIIRVRTGTEFTIIYKLYDEKCVFMQLHPATPCVTLTYAEEIICELFKTDTIKQMSEQVRLYNLILTGKFSDSFVVEPTEFEFCEVVNDPECLYGVPLDWVHTLCPDEVLWDFDRYLEREPKQTFKTVSSATR